jgi:Ca-activated chloride channel homolog
MSHRWMNLCIVLAAFSFFLVCGCETNFSPDSSSSSLPYATGFGATQGGVQDMDLARELIASGWVPPGDAFTVEGMFSQHDLPLDGEAGESVLNLRGGLGCAADLTGCAAGWIQVGLSSNIDPESFQRPTLSIIACVDVSGSMGWFYSGDETEYPTPGSMSRLLLTMIADQLDGNDRIGIVTFGSDVNTLLEPVAADSPSVDSAIGELAANGSTNMEAGLLTAYAVANAELEAGCDEVRVLLFTDMQPNVGETSGESFRGIAGLGVENSIGLSVFGMGVGLNSEVMNVISDLWGGNAYSLFDAEDVAQLVEMNWPWMVVPIAHYLSLEIETPSGISVESAYGFPGFSGGNLGFNVASVFPSHRRGALLACLKPDEGSSMSGVSITGHLAFSTPAGSSVTQDLTWNFPTESIPADSLWYDQPAVGKTVALAVLVSGMKMAVEAYGGESVLAVEIMQNVLNRIETDAGLLEDEALLIEVQLATDLLALMEAGAHQGGMYGWPGY